MVLQWCSITTPNLQYKQPNYNVYIRQLRYFTANFIGYLNATGFSIAVILRIESTYIGWFGGRGWLGGRGLDGMKSGDW